MDHLNQYTVYHHSVLLVALLCVLPLLMSAASASADEEWHNATEFELEGKGWTDTAAIYDRLPTHAKGKVPQDVWDLSKHSAGLCVRFQTDSRQISVRWSLIGDNLSMPHMPATGVSGVDLYHKNAHDQYRFVMNGRPVSAHDNLAAMDTGESSGQMQEYLLYLPLYNGVRSLEIGITQGTRIGKAPPRPASKSRSVVFYGTSIVQGGCASRPGMAHVAILGRMLDRPVINLGFSGSGKMEPEVSALLAELDPAAFVIDCLWNMGGLHAEEIAGRVKTLVQTIRRSRPQTPILFVGQSNIRADRHPMPASRIQNEAVRQLMAQGVPNLYLIGGEHLLGSDEEGTVDGVHPNDLGMMRQAEALYPVLRTILEKHASQ